MKREDTIKQHLEDFLKGKTAEYREKFLSRDLNRQYQSIMAWRHRKSQTTKGNMNSASNVISALRMVRKGISTMPELSDRELRRLAKEVEELATSLRDYERLRKEQEIKELERQQAVLAKRLSALKGEK